MSGNDINLIKNPIPLPPFTPPKFAPVKLSDNNNIITTLSAHRIIALTFIDNPENRELREEIAKHDYKNAAKLIKDVIMSIDYSHNKSA